MFYIEICKVTHMHGLPFAYFVVYKGSSHPSFPRGGQHNLLGALDYIYSYFISLLLLLLSFPSPHSLPCVGFHSSSSSIFPFLYCLIRPASRTLDIVWSPMQQLELYEMSSSILIASIWRYLHHVGVDAHVVKVVACIYSKLMCICWSLMGDRVK